MDNTSKFTAEELQALRAPFALNQHTIREGYRPYDNALTWFVWVERSFIQDRLDQLFHDEWQRPRHPARLSPA